MIHRVALKLNSRQLVLGNRLLLSAPKSRGVSGAKKAIWVINEKHLAEHNPF